MLCVFPGEKKQTKTQLQQSRLKDYKKKIQANSKGQNRMDT